MSKSSAPLVIRAPRASLNMRDEAPLRPSQTPDVSITLPSVRLSPHSHVHRFSTRTCWLLNLPVPRPSSWHPGNHFSEDTDKEIEGQVGIIGKCHTPGLGAKCLHTCLSGPAGA